MLASPIRLVPSLPRTKMEYAPAEQFPLNSAMDIGHSTVQLPSMNGVSIPPLCGTPVLNDCAHRLTTYSRMKPHVERIDTTFSAPGFPPAPTCAPKLESPSLSNSCDFSGEYFLGTAEYSPGEETSGPATPLSSDEYFFHVPFPTLTGPYISRPRKELDAVFSHGPPCDVVVPSQSPLLERLSGNDAKGADEAVGAESEDTWSLVPYNIPWGSSYYGYKRGTLPGPDGKAIFLRSPTPLKNQRTGQACERCRERKAKCSGTRPSCARCTSRGHVCEYGPEIKKGRQIAGISEDEDGWDEDETASDCEVSQPCPLLSVTAPPDSPLSPQRHHYPTNKPLPRKRRNTDLGPIRTHSAPRTIVRRCSALELSSHPDTSKKRRVAKLGAPNFFTASDVSTSGSVPSSGLASQPYTQPSCPGFHDPGVTAATFHPCSISTSITYEESTTQMPQVFAQVQIPSLDTGASQPGSTLNSSGSEEVALHTSHDSFSVDHSAVSFEDPTMQIESQSSGMPSVAFSYFDGLDGAGCDYLSSPYYQGSATESTVPGSHRFPLPWGSYSAVDDHSSNVLDGTMDMMPNDGTSMFVALEPSNSSTFITPNTYALSQRNSFDLDAGLWLGLNDQEAHYGLMTPICV